MNDETNLRILFLAISLSSRRAGAGAPQPPKARTARSGFEPVNGDMMQPGECIPAVALVGAAYGFIFAALVVCRVGGARARAASRRRSTSCAREAEERLAG